MKCRNYRHVSLSLHVNVPVQILPHTCICLSKCNVLRLADCKGGRALSPFFGPPRKPKIKSYFTKFSLICLIR